MTENALMKEMAEFVAKVAVGTRTGKIGWEETADEAILHAVLNGEYVLKLELVPDFGSDSEDPDHILSLHRGKRKVLSVTRLHFPVNYQWVPFLRSFDRDWDLAVPHTYSLFKFIWDRALFSARKVDEELETVNKILDQKLDIPF